MPQEVKNLLQNPEWAPGKNGGPEFYSGEGPITYDNFELNGFRTCSITMEDDNMAEDGYDLFFDVTGKKTLMVGMTMRAIEITKFEFMVEFFTGDKLNIKENRQNVTVEVKPEWGNVIAYFEIPENAVYGTFRWYFYDKVTACTYCAPAAYAF